MTQRLRRVVAVWAALIAAGCGSDESPKDHDTTAASAGKVASTPMGGRAGSRSGSEDVDAGKDGTTSANGDACEKLACKAPSRCEERDNAARCVCPDGYSDVHGDGTQCDDKDECADAADNDCDEHARCENTPGSYKCSCFEAYEGDGKRCSCPSGTSEVGGVCLTPDGERCEDNLDCTSGHCVEGICCAVDCGTPNGQCLTAVGATCTDGKTCKYAVAADGTACDDGDACTTQGSCREGKCSKGAQPTSCDDGNPCTDDSCDSAFGCRNQANAASCDDENPCTDNDACTAGRCSGGTVRDCSGQADGCNTGVCDRSSGECKKQAVADGTACDDASTCTLGDQCNAGTCTGANACGPNAAACAPGSPNACTCAATYVASAGLCVPEGDDQCAASPCSPNATCFDPSHAPDDKVCTCKPGFQGDGVTCNPLFPCADNPCGEGRGTCTEGAGGTYTCVCAEGFKSVGGSCVCDLGGTFAVRRKLDLRWPESSTFEAGAESQY